MTFDEAVEAMRDGARVIRTSQVCRERLSPDVVYIGTEPCRLASAWTPDGVPVEVFQGAESRVLFRPSAEDRGATDWIALHGSR